MIYSCLLSLFCSIVFLLGGRRIDQRRIHLGGIRLLLLHGLLRLHHHLLLLLHLLVVWGRTVHNGLLVLPINRLVGVSNGHCLEGLRLGLAHDNATITLLLYNDHSCIIALLGAHVADMSLLKSQHASSSTCSSHHRANAAEQEKEAESPPEPVEIIGRAIRSA